MGKFRLFLALLVVVSHTVWYPIFFSLNIGAIAVAAFFFISGYLMPLAFDANYKFTSFWMRAYHYGINRFLRIYPLYWLSLLLMLALGLRQAVKYPLEPNAHYYHYPITYLQNILLLGLNEKNFWGQDFRFNTPAWTLDVELQYYILVPFLCFGWAVRKRFTNIVIILFVAVSALLLSRLTFVDMNATFFTWSLLFLSGFLYYKLPAIQKIIRGNQSFIYGGIVMLCTLSLLTSNSTRIFAVTCLLVLIAARLLVLQKEKYFGKMDSFWGDLSYPVYIFHYAVIDVTRSLYSKYTVEHTATTMVNATLLLCNIVFATLAGYAMLQIVANPIEKIRNRIKGNLAA